MKPKTKRDIGFILMLGAILLAAQGQNNYSANLKAFGSLWAMIVGFIQLIIAIIIGIYALHLWRMAGRAEATQKTK